VKGEDEEDVTMRKRGELMVLRSWGALVVTEWTPLHQARELVVMFTAAYSLHTREEKCYDDVPLNAISETPTGSLRRLGKYGI
uniref:Uncharacterized protein n=1 Tax=Dicentrarchus labrax TaxID=13489 RepID=A0A8C4NU82_DICLA